MNSELIILQIIEFVGTKMSDGKDLRYFGIKQPDSIATFGDS